MAQQSFKLSSILLLFILTSVRSQPSCEVAGAEDSKCATSSSRDANVMIQGNLKLDAGMQAAKVVSGSNALRFKDTAKAAEEAEIITITKEAYLARRLGNRMIAIAGCPEGYFLQACASYPVNFGDGINYASKRKVCTVTSPPNSHRMKPQDLTVTVTCSKTQKTAVVAVSHFRRHRGVPTATCKKGNALWCYCWSTKGICPQTAFAPTGQTCRVDVRGRRGRRGRHLPSRLWAICSNEKCRGKWVVQTGGNMGDETCLEDCPPGYIRNSFKRGRGGRCEACQGWTSRRRSNVCNRCPAGKVSRGGSDDCQNMQDSCDDLCPCKECMKKIEKTLHKCVGDNGKFHPGNNWCPEMLQLMSCQQFSIGCYYKLLCSARCIDPAWKPTFCGDKTADEPCPSDASLIQDNQTSVEPHVPMALDESMSTKKSC